MNLSVPKQYQTGNGTVNFIGMALFTLTVIALIYNIRESRINIKMHKALDARLADIEKRL